RAVLHETLTLGGRALAAVTWLIFLGLLALGLRAVWAVTAA
ncbi:MAG: succinate dehydrogenase, partial [Rhodospirillales bacterium]|nr:succinate dehydrogenase [Rhodospirillales bacterium]